MNLQLRAVYVCVTSNHAWGKSQDLQTAKLNAGIKTKANEKSCQYYIIAALFNEPTFEEMENLYKCVTVDPEVGKPGFYTENRTQKDTDMINDKLVGWLLIDKKM